MTAPEEDRRFHVTCAIEGCGRWKKSTTDDDEWICGPHWAQVDPGLRAQYRELDANMRRHYTAAGFAGLRGLWRVCKAQAVDRAADVKPKSACYGGRAEA